MLACGQNLSKSGLAMYESLRGSPLCGVSRTQAGRSVGGGFLLAGTFVILCACGSNNGGPQTGVGGGSSLPDSSDAGRPSPGEGFELTPDFDITRPQRPVPPRQQLVDGVATLGGAWGSSGVSGAVPDAGADAGADAGL